MAKAKKTTASKGAPTKDVVEEAVLAEADEIIEEAIANDVPPSGEVIQTDAAVTPKPKSTFLPLVLGGVLSGAVGFGAATYYFMSQPSDTALVLAQVQTTLAAHDKRLEGADGTITELRAGLGGSAPADQTSDGLAQSVLRDEALTKQLGDVTTALSELETRLTTLEKRPLAEAGGITGDAAKAYERELRTMRDLLETQRSDIEELAAEATARIEGVAQQAATSEEAAAATAKETDVRVAVSQLQSALDNGGAFTAAVANLAGVGVDVPNVLAAAATGGVPTLIDLQESYPAAARAGLTASVKATTGDGALGKIGSFFRSQVGARSLTPQEGDDPDAVLSRAEAALGNDDLAGVIALIGALPEAGQAAMSGFVTSANQRNEAVEAVRVLTDSLNGN